MKKAKRSLLGKFDKPVRIACIDRSNGTLDVPMEELTPALQKFYDKHFLPVWGFAIELYNTTKAKASDWQLVYYEHPEQTGVLELGVHQLVRKRLPISKVFVGVLGDEPVSRAASHELFEMVVDPLANLWAQKDKRTQCAYEVCDAVEEDEGRPLIQNGLPMSNFVYPAWFEPIRHPPGTRFDHLGRLKKPFSLTKGGYIIQMRDGRKVFKRFGSHAKRQRFAKEDRRGHRSEFRAREKLHRAH
jgi:hypothetical protein